MASNTTSNSSFIIISSVIFISSSTSTVVITNPTINSVESYRPGLGRKQSHHHTSLAKLLDSLHQMDTALPDNQDLACDTDQEDQEQVKVHSLPVFLICLRVRHNLLK